MNKISLLILVIIIVEYEAKIKIDIEVGINISDVKINYTGYDKDVISDKEIELFDIGNNKLKEAVRKHLKGKPNQVYLKSPTPWGDLYKKYNWEQVTRVTRVKSAKLKDSDLKTLAILEHDFENPSSNVIKVNAALNQEVENTISTTWSKEKEVSISQSIDYDLNVLFAKISGTTEVSVTSSWGESKETSETVMIGSSSGFEVELQPGQAVTAVLSASRRTMEIEVVYTTTLRGNVAVNFRKPFKNHHFYFPAIEGVLESGGLNTEVLVVETIKLGMYTDAALKVYDKKTKMPL